MPERVTLSQALDECRRSLQTAEAREANLLLFASSVAHDFNNLLGGMLAHAALIRDTPGLSAEVRESADIIEKAATRAAELAAQLAGMQPDASPRVPVDIHETIREVVKLVGGTTSPGVRFSERLEAAHTTLVADPSRIVRLLLNLVLNARDAVGDLGEVEISTRDLPGTAIEVIISDNGRGIPADVRDRIFEPSFTTKRGREGRGMGLVIVQRVVEQHGGRLRVESGPGEGSRFVIELPVFLQVAAGA